MRHVNLAIVVACAVVACSGRVTSVGSDPGTSASTAGPAPSNPGAPAAPQTPPPATTTTGPDASSPGADADASKPRCAPIVAHTLSDPNSWTAEGEDPVDYVINVDPNLSYNGRPLAHLKAKVAQPAALGTLDDAIFDASPYAGKRVRFSAGMKGAQVAQAGLYVRADGAGGKVLAMDNMDSHPLTGDVAWNRYQVVIDVPAEATLLAFGLWLDGSGEVWAGDTALEIIEPNEPYVLDPSAWLPAGNDVQSYTIDTDSSVQRCSRPSGHIASIVPAPTGFAALLETLSAADYLGKRVRMSGYVRSSKAQSAGLWLRVDAVDGSTLAFDNMDDRPIQGTTDWAPYDIVLDVPRNAASMAFGMLVSGAGEAWVDGATFEIVGNDVPTTK